MTSSQNASFEINWSILFLSMIPRLVQLHFGRRGLNVPQPSIETSRPTENLTTIAEACHPDCPAVPQDAGPVTTANFGSFVHPSKRRRTAHWVRRACRLQCRDTLLPLLSRDRPPNLGLARLNPAGIARPTFALIEEA